MDFRYTRHQVARGAMADATVGDRLILIKQVSELRATYQIRLLLFRAQQEGKKLTIEMPKQGKIHATLRQLEKDFPRQLRIERK